MGIDPTTHKPKTDHLGSAGSSHSKDVANLSHMAQWESARLEAEARLVRESKFQQHGSSSDQPARLVLNKISAQPSLPPCLDVLKAWQNQNSWSLPTAKGKNTRMHNMYALMLSAADDNLESPTSTLCFPEPLLPPVSTTVGLPIESLLPPATTVSSVAVESWRCLNQEKPDMEIGERRTMSLQDDDIMVAVEAFMAERYKKVPEVLGSNRVMKALNNDDNDVLAYESNDNLAGIYDLGFIDNGDGSMIFGNVNFEDKNHYWNSIYSTELGE